MAFQIKKRWKSSYTLPSSYSSQDRIYRGVLAVALEVAPVLGDRVPGELPVEEADAVGGVEHPLHARQAAQHEEVDDVQLPELGELLGHQVALLDRSDDVARGHVLQERLELVVHH